MGRKGGEVARKEGYAEVEGKGGGEERWPERRDEKRWKERDGGGQVERKLCRRRRREKGKRGEAVRKEG